MLGDEGFDCSRRRRVEIYMVGSTLFGRGVPRSHHLSTLLALVRGKVDGRLIPLLGVA